MILHDTNILSTFAKIDHVDLLFRIFNRSPLYLSENVAAELHAGVRYGYSNLHRVLDLIDPDHPTAFEIVRAGTAERLLYPRIPVYLQGRQRQLKGEIDTIALAWTHGATIVCNERQVYRFCLNNHYQHIPCLRLEDLLRSLWANGFATQNDVRELITNIEILDRVRVNRSEVF